MVEYEIHRLRAAELRHLAAHERLVGEALRAHRAARRSAGAEAPGPRADTNGSRRSRFTRAA